MRSTSAWRNLLESADRRTFLKACGVLGAGLAGGALVKSAIETVASRRRVSETRLAMGTFVTLTAVSESRHRCEAAIGYAFEEMDRLIPLLSRHDSSSPVAVLNSEGRLTDAPPEVVSMIERSRAFHRSTGGAFDITVQPILDLMRKRLAVDPQWTPSLQEVETVLSQVGTNRVELSGRSVALGGDGMGVTFDGIAKGFIVDRMSEILGTMHGVENYLVNAGGDIRTSGERSPGKPWTIAIQNPAENEPYAGLIRLTTGAVATSGNYEVYYDKEKVFHHIVNPSTGVSAAHCAGVTVRAATAMEADALSTATFVLGPERGSRLIDRLDKRECLILDKSGQATRSRGWA